MTDTPWSSVGYLVYKRTYARRIDESDSNSDTEEWIQTIDRVLRATSSQLACGFTVAEEQRLKSHLLELRGSVAGRFLWQLGTSTVDKLGLFSLQNCACVCVDEPIRPFTWAMDALMLGCGVGFNIQREYVYKLPKVREDYVGPSREDGSGADFIVPDTRAGWIKLLEYTLRAAFIKSDREGFSYSTQLVRGAGAAIKGFGGTASGPEILCEGIGNISAVLSSRKGKQLRPIDCLDVMNIIGSIVVAGNVRRSAQIAIGDADDFQYLRSKRWDLGNIPNWRANSNNSVVCNDIAVIPDEIWKGYLGNGEPFGLINLKLARREGRTGERQYPDKEVIGFNPCMAGTTKLLTRAGYAEIRDVVGKNVEVWNGYEWSEVVPFSTGRNPLMRVRLDNGATFLCTPYHKFILAGNIKVCADELNEGDRLEKFQMPTVTEGKSFDIDAYSQGFYSGDGNTDYEYSYLYEPKYSCESRLIGTTVPDTAVRRRWKHGVMYKKNWVPLEGILQYKLDWLAGVCDSDGTVTRDENGNGIQITSIDHNFLEEIRLLLSTMGVSAKIVGGNPAGIREMPDGRGGSKEYECKETKRILIGNWDTYHLMSLGLKTERLDLHGHAPQRDARRFVRVKAVEPFIDDFGMQVYTETFCVNEPKRNNVTFEGVVTGNCAEQSLANYETCCLAEIFLPNVRDKDELLDVATLLYRVCKHSLNLPCHNKETESIVHKNQRMGIGITGYLQASEEQRSWLKETYEQLREFDRNYSKDNGFPESIKLTTVNWQLH